MDTIFHYSNYQGYLKDWIKSRPKGGHGTQAQMAKSLKCHTTFVSQILKGKAQLSTEHAMGLNRFFKHNAGESHHLILLVHLARAGTVDLKKYYSDQIKTSVDAHLNLASRIQYDQKLSSEIAARYYQNWMVTAVHVALSIPALQTPEAIARELGILLPRVEEILKFLESVELARVQAGHHRRYEMGKTQLFLPKDSYSIAKHHTNWRMRAIRSLDEEQPNEFHYSSVVSLSKKDLAALKEIMIGAVEEIRGKVKASKEEVLCCYTLDLFSLVRGE